MDPDLSKNPEDWILVEDSIGINLANCFGRVPKLTLAHLIYIVVGLTNMPWKSNHHFLYVGLRTTFFYSKVYHHPKGTSIF